MCQEWKNIYILMSNDLKSIEENEEWKIGKVLRRNYQSKGAAVMRWLFR